VGHAAEPIEIAEVLLFLASDRNTFMTGETLIVDGGYTLAGK
jgi:3-oxoacyl-[acyl-carrier protein] reductase